MYYINTDHVSLWKGSGLATFAFGLKSGLKCTSLSHSMWLSPIDHEAEDLKIQVRATDDEMATLLKQGGSVASHGEDRV